MLININDTEYIKEIKQQIENVENILTQLRNFYIENKDKENNYEIVKTFFDNTIFIQKNTSDIFSCYKNNNYETFLRHYKHNCDYATVDGFIAHQKRKEILKIICDEEEMKLIFKMGLLKEKLEYYENLIWQNNITLVISWLYTSVSFLMYIVATMITVLILNIIIYQFLHTAVMMSRVQCLH
jgi:hypothetical protein